MRKPFSIVAALVVALAIAQPSPVDALDLGKTVKKTVKKVTRNVANAVGGGSGGNLSSTGSSGGSSGGGLLGTSARVNAPGDEAAASVKLSVGNTSVGAAVLSKGQLASLGLSSNPRGTGNTRASDGSVVGVTSDYVRELIASMSWREKQTFRLKCDSVLRSPQAFDAELFLLCKIAKELA